MWSAGVAIVERCCGGDGFPSPPLSRYSLT
jgi:hypothetical protein